MIIKTGQTIHELVVAVDSNNLPISSSTFNSIFFIDGIVNNTISPSLSLVDASSATFSISWSAITTGYHQLYLKNNNTSVIYISDIYSVLPDSEVDPSTTVFVGL